MNSKEALEIIIFRLTSHEEDLELRETDKKAIEIIKQDLERLEVLEKEYEEYKKLSIEVRNAFQICNRNLSQENEKLKKAIEILKIKTPIQFLGFNKYGAKPYEIISNGVVIGLDQQEYELLKEVLGNEMV